MKKDNIENDDLKKENMEEHVDQKNKKETKEKKVKKQKEEKDKLEELEENIKKESEVLEKKKKRKDAIIAVVVVIALLVIVTVVIFFINGLDTTTTESHNFYQYFAGQKVEYKGQLTLSRKEGITELKSKDKTVTLDSTPVYYGDNANKVIFPENMAIIYPTQSGIMYKVNHFSDIVREGSSTYLEVNTTTTTQKKLVENAFLFDGADLYFFLQNTIIHANGSDYEVTPLSYAIVRYNQGVEIYNKEKDEYTVVETKENVTATTADYTINMSIDALKSAEKDQLLIKNINYLQNVE